MENKHSSVAAMIWEKTAGINQKIRTIRDDFLKHEKDPNLAPTTDQFIIILSKYSEVILEYNSLLAQIILELTGEKLVNSNLNLIENAIGHKQ
jgi:hypothetical protein